MSSVELWKSFVDSFAQMHDGVHHSWVAERGSYPNTPDNQEINGFLKQLSADQRKLLARMLVNARHGGIHDALVVLNDRIALQGGNYSEDGVKMEFQPFGSELYYDYVCRRSGDEWPAT